MQKTKFNIEFWQKREWNYLLTALVVLLLVLFIIELTVPMNDSVRTVVAAAELVALIAITIDLYFKFTRSTSKKEFVKENWMSILLLLPASLFAFAFRFAGSSARVLGISGEALGGGAAELRIGEKVGLLAVRESTASEVLIARGQKFVASLADAASLAMKFLRRAK